MHEYDTVLKRLLEKSHQRLTGERVVRWLSTELPIVQNLRVDLLGETADGELIQLEETVREEAKKVLTIDISENKVLGPAYQRGRLEGLDEGMQAGRQAGLQEGRQEGQLGLLVRLIESKFGPLPSWAAKKLSERASQDLEQIGIHLFEAKTLEDLLR